MFISDFLLLYSLAVLRLMRYLVIYMNKGPLDIGQCLQLILQILTQIMRLPQRCVGRHDNVDLDDEAWARVVGLARVDGSDAVVECHGLVDYQAEEVRVCGIACQ